MGGKRHVKSVQMNDRMIQRLFFIIVGMDIYGTPSLEAHLDLVLAFHYSDRKLCRAHQKYLWGTVADAGVCGWAGALDKH